MNVVSFGGGTNSTAMIIGMYLHKIPIDLILFADTGGEQPHTYEFMGTFNEWLVKHGIPKIVSVEYHDKDGNRLTLEQECINSGRLPSIAYGYKKCSLKHKIGTQEKFCNNYQPCKEVWASGQRVHKYIGYDAGETRRIQHAAPIDEADKKYEKHYPLYEWGWTREECVHVIERAGLPRPGKSSCFFCPSMKKKEIQALWVNVGDSYATKSGNQPPKNTRNSCGHTAKRVPQGYKKKDLIGIPWQLAFALRADGWYLRQDIIWQKPNCMPESVSDRCTKSHEYIFLLSKSERYYFDAAAISEPVTSARGNARTFRGGGAYTGGRSHNNSAQVERESHGNSENKAGRRNKRSVWSVSTNGFRGAHFAVFPEKLIEPCILAGCPEGGVVLDPFAGSGTTGVVAKRMGRGFVGCEINPSYVAMAAGRIAEVK